MALPEYLFRQNREQMQEAMPQTENSIDIDGGRGHGISSHASIIQRNSIAEMPDITH